MSKETVNKKGLQKYDPSKIEKKWQKIWATKNVFETKSKSKKEKFYILDMFPYPSGEGLHVGHPKGYIATDIYSRFKRMSGFNVLHPMGFDAFGLPAENYAIKNKVHPRVAVSKNINRYKKQLEILGLDYDWCREIDTTDPTYYKWTQWIFTKLFEKGLAYESFEPINWCPSCKTGLANEDVEDGKCERCGTVVEKKPMRQWVLKITDYAEKLLEGLKDLDWPHSIKESQVNWIGKSLGSEFDLKIKSSDEKIKIFTTRADTFFGITYVVLAPEHKLVSKIIEKVSNRNEVEKYISESKNKTAIERTAEGKEKTGVKLEGVLAINPVNGDEVSVFLGDYVLADYGTGAVMAVPAHDERDFDFAKKHNIEIKQVIKSVSENKDIEKAFTEDGVLIDSGKYSGLTSEEARKQITKDFGTEVVKYKLRDWVFSRQRYWGEPMPIVHDENGKAFVVDESELPVVLPNVKSYEPTGTGESPLADIKNWVEIYGYINKKGKFVSSKKTDKKAKLFKRETNTMPQWAGSSWYYLRYMDPQNKKTFVDKKTEKYFSPVDFYVGGAEHATRHLIYARFWHRFLYDNGFVSTKEPFKKLQHVGLIFGEDGRKMSKRFGNVVNPDDVVDRFGADSFRMYEMFIGPFDQAVAWSENGILGTRRFLERVWSLQEKVSKEKPSKELISEINKLTKKVTEDISDFKFNTVISQLMVFSNKLVEFETVPKEIYETFIKILCPFAPHTAEEIWQNLKNKNLIVLEKWPKFDEKKIFESSVKIVIQINGKTRDIIEVSPETAEQELFEIATQKENVKKWLEGKEIVKKIYVKNRLINIVIK